MVYLLSLHRPRISSSPPLWLAELCISPCKLTQQASRMENICLCKALAPFVPPQSNLQLPYHYLFLASFFWIPLSFSVFYSPLWNRHEKPWKASKHELLHFLQTREKINESPKRFFWRCILESRSEKRGRILSKTWPLGWLEYGWARYKTGPTVFAIFRG